MFWTDPAFRKYRMLSETAKALQREISRCKALSISYLETSDKKQIRMHLRKEVRSDLLGMVHHRGLEPRTH